MTFTISPFALGFLLGFLLGIVFIVIIALWSMRSKKKSRTEKKGNGRV